MHTPLQTALARPGTMQSMFNHGPRALAAMSQTPFIVQRDTRAWQLQVWISFGIAVFLCAVGLAWLPGEPLEQVFMVMGYHYCPVKYQTNSIGYRWQAG